MPQLSMTTLVFVEKLLSCRLQHTFDTLIGQHMQVDEDEAQHTLTARQITDRLGGVGGTHTHTHTHTLTHTHTHTH